MAVSTSAARRLRQDYVRLMKDPVPYIEAAPCPSNILEWHYILEGPPDSVYSGGYYHGKLVFPAEYPFKPPSIYILTPNGRFKVNSRLCLSISDFHPDTWNPAWSVATILTGLMSFMLEASTTLGSIESSDLEKKRLARQSLEYNLKNKLVKELFPRTAEEMQHKLQKYKTENGSAFQGQMNASDSSSDRAANLHGSTLSNFLVFAGLVAFVLVAKYVLQSAITEF